MQLLAAFALSLLLYPISAVFVAYYANPECTGDIVRGYSIPDNTCTPGSEPIVCNATHAYKLRYSDPGCTGTSVVVNPMPVGSCINATQFFCGEKELPNNAYVNIRYSEGACQGIKTTNWQLLDVCAPGEMGRRVYSSKLSYENKTVMGTMYASPDCTGVGQTAATPSGGDSTSYTTKEIDISGFYYTYQYVDTQKCTGAPVGGRGMRIGQCYYGRRVECENNEFRVWNYQNKNCAGVGQIHSNYTVGECVAGIKAHCSGTFTVPPASRLEEHFDGDTPCEGRTIASFDVTGVCYEGRKMSSAPWIITLHNATTNSISTYSYETENCTGSALEDRFPLISHFTCFNPRL